MSTGLSVKKKKVSAFATPYTLKNAIVKGDWSTKLSIIIMGAGNIAKGQVIKGILFFLSELAFIYFMINTGVHNLSMLPSLGDQAQQEIWNEKKGIYEYVAGDNSLLILLYGVITLFIIFMFIFLWKAAVTSAYKVQCISKANKHVNTFVEDFKSL